MRNLIIVLVLILLIIVGVFAFLPKDNQEVSNIENTNTLENNTSDNFEVNNNTEVNLDSNLNTNIDDNNEIALVAEPKIKGSYQIYDSTKIILAQNNDVVLFFHASWCPYCRALDKDINQNLGNIPEGVLIMKVDYDKEGELKKKYGVTSQHTLVQVDGNGNMIAKWSGSSSLVKLLEKIQ